MPHNDPFDLERFVSAQNHGVYQTALAELQAGEKQSHWMWFIFPQHRNLGQSWRAKYYGLSGQAEAIAYLAHPILGPRLKECVKAAEAQLASGKTLEQVLGTVDALKYRSAIDLFASAMRDPFFVEAGM